MAAMCRSQERSSGLLVSIDTRSSISCIHSWPALSCTSLRRRFLNQESWHGSVEHNMRVVRKIFDECQFDATCISDLQVRTRHDIQSVDCVLLKMRLRYLCRVLRSDCDSLRSMLALRFEEVEAFCCSIGYSPKQAARHRGRSGVVAPWMCQAVEDLRALQIHCGSFGLPSPTEHSFHFWTSEVERWEGAVSNIFSSRACATRMRLFFPSTCSPSMPALNVASHLRVRRHCSSIVVHGTAIERWLACLLARTISVRLARRCTRVGPGSSPI